jgi:hypothetical protein
LPSGRIFFRFRLKGITRWDFRLTQEFKGSPDRDLKITKMYIVLITSGWRRLLQRLEYQINRIKVLRKSISKKHLVYLYKTYYAKHLISLCSVSIVKRGHLLLSIFWSSHKKKENTKNNSSEKRMLER